MTISRVTLTPRADPEATVTLDIPNDDGKSEAQVVFLAMLRIAELGVEVLYYPEIEEVDE